MIPKKPSIIPKIAFPLISLFYLVAGAMTLLAKKEMTQGVLLILAGICFIFVSLRLWRKNKQNNAGE